MVPSVGFIHMVCMHVYARSTSWLDLTKPMVVLNFGNWWWTLGIQGGQCTYVCAPIYASINNALWKGLVRAMGGNYRWCQTYLTVLSLTSRRHKAQTCTCGHVQSIHHMVWRRHYRLYGGPLPHQCKMEVALASLKIFI